MNHVSLADTTWLRRITKKVAMVEEVVEEFTELEVIVKERKLLIRLQRLQGKGGSSWFKGLHRGG